MAPLVEDLYDDAVRIARDLAELIGIAEEQEFRSGLVGSTVDPRFGEEIRSLTNKLVEALGEGL